jgi:hypothetical protein
MFPNVDIQTRLNTPFDSVLSEVKSFCHHVKGQRVCGVSVFFGSRKQKCVSKSPTKADLVALSDYIGFIELFEEMIAFMLNMKCREPLVYQDNDLVIEMVTSGGGVTRTKKMRTRMYLVLEAVNKK